MSVHRSCLVTIRFVSKKTREFETIAILLERVDRHARVDERTVFVTWKRAPYERHLIGRWQKGLCVRLALLNMPLLRSLRLFAQGNYKDSTPKELRSRLLQSVPPHAVKPSVSARARLRLRRWPFVLPRSGPQYRVPFLPRAGVNGCSAGSQLERYAGLSAPGWLNRNTS